MKELNDQELINIEGGNPFVVAGLIIATGTLYLQALEHCYEIGED